jgi:hypothetical protein
LQPDIWLAKGEGIHGLLRMSQKNSLLKLPVFQVILVIIIFHLQILQNPASFQYHNHGFREKYPDIRSRSARIFPELRQVLKKQQEIW